MRSGRTGVQSKTAWELGLPEGHGGVGGLSLLELTSDFSLGHTEPVCAWKAGRPEPADLRPADQLTSGCG